MNFVVPKGPVNLIETDCERLLMSMCLMFVYVCFVIYILWTLFCRLDLRKGLFTYYILGLGGAFVYNTVLLSWGDPVWRTGH